MVSPTVRIPIDQLSWRFSTSGGPGGQHVDTSHTKAEVVLDLQACRTLPEGVKDRLLAKLGPVVSVTASDSRSQVRNRQLALRRLGERLLAALAEDRPRRPTRRSAASQRRRVADKRRQSARKAERQYRPDDHDS